MFRRHLTNEQRAAAVASAMRRTGELGKLEEEAAASAKENRGAHAKELSAAKKNGTAPSKTKKGPTHGKVAEVLAKKARVTPVTAARVLRTEKKDPIRFEKLAKGTNEEKRGKGARTKWSVPADPAELGQFLADKYTMGQLTTLAKALVKGAPRLLAAFE